MQRWTAAVFGVFFLAFAAIVIVKTGGSSSSSGAKADAGPDGAAPAADAGEPAAEDGGSSVAAEPSAEALDAGLDDQADAGKGVGRKLLSGEDPPALAGEAPKSVVFGVVLVQYKGSQGAPPGIRSRDEALELAKKLAAEAAQDFKATVAKGDKGSMENAGRIPRGILEPAPEYILFSLEKGAVGGPVDTPRGFWIVQRIE